MTTESGSAPQHRSRELRSLTFLRFVAAFALFAFHIRIHFGQSGQLPGLIDRPLLNGAALMSLFFVLSGFILAYSYMTTPTDLKTYAIRRIARIAPIYYLAAATTLFWIFPWRSATGDIQTVMQVVLIFSLTVLFIQAWFPPLFAFWNNGGAWSLSVEAFLYATFPVALYFIRAASNRALIITLVVAMIASAIPGLVYVSFPGAAPIYYSMPIFRLPEFIAGCSAGALFVNGNRLRYPFVWLAASLAALLATMSILTNGIYVHGNIVYVPAIVLTIWACASAEVAGRLKTPDVGVYLGNISYCIYSSQVMVLLPLIAIKGSRPNSALFEPHIIWPVATAIVLALSSAMHLAVEEPMRKWITRTYAGRSAVSRQPAS